jgi:hypothetical protein
MNQYSYKHFTTLKKDVEEFRELSSFQYFLLEQLTKKQQVEIILLYDALLTRLSDLVEYPVMNEEQKKYIEICPGNERVELIKIFNTTITEINRITG